MTDLGKSVLSAAELGFGMLGTRRGENGRRVGGGSLRVVEKGLQQSKGERIEEAWVLEQKEAARGRRRRNN